MAKAYDVETSAPAGPKTGDGVAYPVTVEGAPPMHLTVTSIETLCNVALGPTATVAAAFGPTDCPTCRKMARARNLAVASSGPRAMAIGRSSGGH